jgi:hypothetical protein
MTPMLFEALIFLKVNHRFWNQDTLCRAVAMACTERSDEHLKSNAKQKEVACGLNGGEGE